MRKVLAFTLALACLLSLSGCGCEHEWMAATCTEAETCALCGKVQGEKADHIWAAATCEAPQACASCGLSQGEKLPHSWMDATTEEPQTCETCGTTQGDRIVTDERFTTANNQVLFGLWKCPVNMAYYAPNLAPYDGDWIFLLTFAFDNDGTMRIYCTEEDADAFLAQYKTNVTAMIFADFEAAGMDEEAARELIMDSLGLSVEEYIDAMIAEINLEAILQDMLDQFAIAGVYYMESDQLYMGSGWNEELGNVPFLLEDNMLTFPEGLSQFGYLVLHRAEA